MTTTAPLRNTAQSPNQPQQPHNSSSRSPIPGLKKRASATVATGENANGASGAGNAGKGGRPPNNRGDSKHKLTVAEQYANAHSKGTTARDKENTGLGIGNGAGPVGGNKKPIFEWISRKLGGGKKSDVGSPGQGFGPAGETPHPSPKNSGMATLPNLGKGPSTPRHRMVSLPVNNDASGSEVPVEGRKGRGRRSASTSPQKVSVSPINPFPPLSRDDSGRFTRSESVSLRLYPHSIAESERMRIREANNPYPSLPVGPLRARDSTLDSTSMSFLTRTSSMHSETSTRPRISFADDTSLRDSVPTEADEDASIRPFPPSHPASPTPSASVISRSASASLLSPVTATGPGLSFARSGSPIFNRPSTQYSASTNSSDIGRHSRRDSASTKPTTILSIDSGPHAAHIAQAQPQSGNALPGSPGQSSGLRNSMDIDTAGPSTMTTPLSGSPPTTTPASMTPPSLHYAQAPKHSQPHPRDNPHPASPPEPNASTVTLASSTFNLPGPTPGTSSTASTSVPGPASVRLRELSTSSIPINQIQTAHAAGGIGRSGLATSPSVTFAPDPSSDRPPSTIDSGPPSGPPSTHALSLYGHAPSMSVRTGGWHGGSRGMADGDASVRAVRRKGSNESDESSRSRWSWRGARPPTQGVSSMSTSYEPGGNAQFAVMDDDSSSKRARYYASVGADTAVEPVTSAQAAIESGAVSGGVVVVGPERPPSSARESLITRESYATARGMMPMEGQDAGDGASIGRAGLETVSEPVAAR